ncbi:3780_t:CDS:2 [Funneliformis geosporum]|nr:3780_t:CDS:2 [Funneliformis geosporum]
MGIQHKEKIEMIAYQQNDQNLTGVGHCHKNFHSGNILQNKYYKSSSLRLTHVTDIGLLGPADQQESDDKIYGVLPYIAPEVLHGEPYTLASDIYSFGVIMTEISSGKPPFYNRKHDSTLASDICNGLRPEFGNGTPEFYKNLAHRCMNANPDQRPTSNELYDIFEFWDGTNYENYTELYYY